MTKERSRITGRAPWTLVCAWVVALMGMVNLAEALLPKDPAVLDWMEQWIPFSASAHSRLLLLPSGLALIGLARGLARRKRLAWVLTLGVLGLSMALHLLRAFDWHHCVLAAALAGLLVWRRGEFVALSDRASVKAGLVVIPLIAAGIVVYGAMGLGELRNARATPEIEGGETWLQRAQAAAELVFLQSTGTVRPLTARAEHFFRLIQAYAVAGGLAGLLILLRPVMETGHLRAREGDMERFRALVRQHGDDPMNEFIFAPDKNHFYDPATESLTAFVLWRNYAVVLADPVCPHGRRVDATRAFLDFCTINDWEPLFYCASAAHRPVYENLGLATWKIAEDARISVEGFNLKGGKFQNLRTACNKAVKEGFQVRWYEPEAEGGAVDHGLEAQLRLISDEWLAAKRTREMAFDLGQFDTAQIRRHGASVVLSPDGRAEAFATWLPYAWRGKETPSGRALDLMRSRPGTRNLMDFLIVQTIDHFKARGVAEISLGNAPLANVESGAAGLKRQERAARFLFENFNIFYGYKSLFQFKEKYQPVWKGRYAAHRPGINPLMMATALVMVHFPKGLFHFVKS